MYWIIILLLVLFIFGATGVFTMVRYLVRFKRAKIKLSSRPKRLSVTIFSLLIIAVTISSGSLYWVVDGYILEDVPYSFKIENSIDHHGYFQPYKLVERIEPEFSSQPLIIIKHDKNLILGTLKTRKMMIGLKKYWVNGGITLVDGEKRFGYSIDENQINGGATQIFPNVWFGVIYNDKRDNIRINGKVPITHNIHFDGIEYVFWYIERNAKEAILSF